MFLNPSKKNSSYCLIMLLWIWLLSQQNSVAEAGNNKNSVVVSDEQSLATAMGGGDSLQRTVARATLNTEAYRLFKLGRYEEAIAKYQEELQPKYIKDREDRNAALTGLVNAKQAQGKYEEALEINTYLINTSWRNTSGRPDWWELRSKELEALIEFRKTGEIDSVKQYLLYRYKVLKKEIERREVELQFQDFFEKSLYLYEIIEDYDSALKLCDEYLAMKKVKKDKKFKAEVEDLRKTVLEAKQTKQKGIIFKKLNQYGFYNWL